MQEQIFQIYQKTINKIEDITEYEVYRPKWLREILLDMHNQIRDVAKMESDDGQT